MALAASRTWTLYSSAIPQLRAGTIDVGSNAFKAVLLSTGYDPSSGVDDQRADLATYAFTSAANDPTVTLSHATDTDTVSVSADVQLSSGGVSPRYVAIYDDDTAGDELLCVADIGAAQVVPSGVTFTLPSQTLFTLDGITTGGVSLFFHADWDTATGQSTNALTDGGVFTNTSIIGGYDNPIAIASASGLNWTRTSNVLRIEYLVTGGSVYHYGNVYHPTAIAESTSFYIRMFFRNDETLNLSNHPFNLNLGIGGDTIQLVMWQKSQKAGATYEISHNFPGESYPYLRWYYNPDKVTRSTALDNGTWYRYEAYVQYVTSSTVRLYPRLYNMSGTLLGDSTDWVRTDYPGANSRTLQQHYDLGNTISINDTTQARELAIGQEGPAGSTNNPGVYWYIADVALSYDGWIGDQ